MTPDLQIVLWPDPRLKKISQPVTAFDQNLASLVGQMFELMREAKGVGLAAPQVGQNVRLFVTNSDGEPGNDRVYVNPVLSEFAGDEEDEEGCLSLPKVNVSVVRSKTLRIKAQNLVGEPFEEVAEGFVARIWQHETDHLNGTLLTDRMGPVAKMAHRKILRDLQADYDESRPKSQRR